MADEARPVPGLLLVRHGRTAWNAARRIQGRSDIPLDDEGRAQARAAGRALARHLPAGGPAPTVTCSPQERARETAAIIAGLLGAPDPEPDADLMEREFGVAEGMAMPEAQHRWPGLAGIPGAESLEELAERAHRAFLRHLAAGEPRILVAHGQLLRFGIRRVLGEEIPRLGNAEIWHLGQAPGNPGRTTVRLLRAGDHGRPADSAGGDGGAGKAEPITR